VCWTVLNGRGLTTGTSEFFGIEGSICFLETHARQKKKMWIHGKQRKEIENRKCVHQRNEDGSAFSNITATQWTFPTSLWDKKHGHEKETHNGGRVQHGRQEQQTIKNKTWKTEVEILDPTTGTVTFLKIQRIRNAYELFLWDSAWVPVIRYLNLEGTRKKRCKNEWT
jgi:hypothetical protein